MIGKYSNQDFLKIYMDSINELRENGKVFSQQNPDLAPYLDLSYRKSNDPETERLIESFAYMFAQVEHKSILAKNDYALNFIDHMFPELISPIPALTVLKITPEKSFFSKEKINFMMPKSTLFSVKNQNGFECQFSSTQEISVSSFNILNSSFIDSSLNKEDICKHKKAFVVNFESMFPLSVNKQNSVHLPIYIDSDFYSSISIYDALFLSQKPMLLFVDDKVEPIVLGKENLTPIFLFESQDKKNNLLYPLFDYLNYFQKYFFIELKLNINFELNNKFKLVIPIEDHFENLSRIGNSFFHLNCVPVANYFERKMEPIKCSAEKDEYFIRVDGSLENEIEVLNINSLKIYNSKTGEAFRLPCFHGEKKEEKSNLQNLYKNFLWATKRSFYDPTKENGTFHIKLLYNEKKQNEEIIWPDYLFPSGNCTNGKLANYIKPLSEFQFNSSAFPILKAHSLFWPMYSRRPLKNFDNTDVLKLLYRLNQEIISKKILNDPEFEKVLNYLTSGSNPVKSLIKQIFMQSSGFIIEESITQQIWKKQSYHVPGVVYKLQFLKKEGFPRGIQFFLNFLNGYFSYIRDFNYCISFEAVLL